MALLFAPAKSATSIMRKQTLIFEEDLTMKKNLKKKLAENNNVENLLVGITIGSAGIAGFIWGYLIGFEKGGK